MDPMYHLQIKLVTSYRVHRSQCLFNLVDADFFLKGLD